MKLKTFLFLGAVGGVVAALRKRGAPEPVQQAASQAAAKASDLADKAKEAAPEPVKQAVETVAEKVTGDGGEDRDATRRYAAPAEAGAQPPSDSGEAPADDSQATVARSVASDDTDSLQTKAHDLPGDAVMPDTSDDDPSVRAAESAAAADAGAIGGNVDRLAQDEPGFPEDPSTRPVIEGSGDDEETLEARDSELGGNRETQA